MYKGTEVSVGTERGQIMKKTCRNCMKEVRRFSASRYLSTREGLIGDGWHVVSEGGVPVMEGAA